MFAVSSPAVLLQHNSSSAADATSHRGNDGSRVSTRHMSASRPSLTRSHSDVSRDNVMLGQVSATDSSHFSSNMRHHHHHQGATATAATATAVSIAVIALTPGHQNFISVGLFLPSLLSLFPATKCLSN